MTISIAHVVNPVRVGTESDLFVAQPITFASLERAKSFATHVDVQHFAICYPEDREIVPEGFTMLPFLTRSVLDVSHFQLSRKLPLLCDIINGLSAHSHAEYLVYTNADIAVQPHFYETIAWIIRQGYDAFVINRRTIKDLYKSSNDLSFMYAQVGEPHSGHDCFVFKKELVINFYLSFVCIGVNWVGRVLIWNLIALSTKFEEFKDLHVTFHLGNEKRWKNPVLEDYRVFNNKQALDVFDFLSTKYKLPDFLSSTYSHLLTK